MCCLSNEPRVDVGNSDAMLHRCITPQSAPRYPRGSTGGNQQQKKLWGVFNYSSRSCSWSWYVTVKKPCCFFQPHGFYQIQIFTLHSTPGNRATGAWRMEKPRSLLIWHFVCLHGIVHHKFPLTCTASKLTDVKAKQKENKLKSEGNREIMKRKRPWMRQYNVSKCSINASVMGC